MKLTFWYVRHGETLFNTVRRMQGQCDSPLTAKGIRQAENTASALRSIHFDRAYCSSSERAWDTAQILCRGRNITPVCMKGLKEFRFGDLDGKLISDFNDRIQPHRMADDWTDVGGENVEMFRERAEKAFAQIVEESEDGDTVLIVSHGSYFMHLMKTLLNYDQQEYIQRMFAQNRPFIPNAGIAVFTYEDGKYSLIREPVTAEEFRELQQKTVTFYYVRHGETVFNTEKRMQGWSDSPLTEDGIWQAEKTGRYLSNKEFSTAYVSTSERARDTADILLAGKNIPVHYDRRLREVFFGTMEGSRYEPRWKEVYSRLETEDWSDLSGENKEDVFIRLTDFLRDAYDAAEDGDTVLLVSHSILYIDLMELLFQTDRSSFSGSHAENPIPNGGICIFERTGNTYRLIQKMKAPEESE